VVGEALGPAAGQVSPDPGVDRPRLEAGDVGDLGDGSPAGDQEDGLEPAEGPGVRAGVGRPGEPAAVVVVEAEVSRCPGGSHTRA